MKNNIYKISYLFLLVILFSNSFSTSVLAQQELILEKITDFDNISAGNKTHMELKMINNTDDPMVGVLDITVYQGNELFDGEGLTLRFLPDNSTNSWLDASNWLNGAVFFNGFNIASGETLVSIEIITHPALVSGEYLFEISLHGTNDSGEEYSAPVIFAGGGGGGILHVDPLVVENEDVTEASVPLGTAIITWDTNLLSTSQVIYGLESEGPYVLDLSDDETGPTYLGYPLWTNEDKIKVVSHSVLLTGLVNGETYKFRVVSRASPPTIGFEYTFEFREPAEGTDGTEGGIISYLDTSPQVIVAGGVKKEDVEVPWKEEVSVGENEEGSVATIEDDGDDESLNQNLASILFAFPGFSSQCLLYLLLILFVLFLAQKLWNGFIREEDKEHNAKDDTLFWIIGVVIAIVIASVVSYWCVVYSLVILLVFLSIWYIIQQYKISK